MPVIVAGRIRLPGLAERALEAGQADFVAVGRGMLADSEWVAKARDGRAGRIRPCIGIVQDCRRYAGGVTCTINPRLGREAEWPEPEAGDRESRRVVVAGGGPAGLEAARVAAEAGHAVVLFERERRRSAASCGRPRPGRRARSCSTSSSISSVSSTASVSTCGSEPPPRPRTCSRRSPTSSSAQPGRSPVPPAFPVAGGARVVTVWDLLGGGGGEIPKRALVLDDGGGFWHGISAAEYLAERGAAVELAHAGAGQWGSRFPRRASRTSSPAPRERRPLPRPLAGGSASTARRCSLADVVTGEPAETQADLVVVVSSLRVDDGACCTELVGKVPLSSRSATAPRHAASTTPCSTPTSRSGVSTKAVSEQIAGDGRRSDSSAMTEFWRMGATPVPSAEIGRLRARVRGERLGRPRRRRGARAAARSVRRRSAVAAAATTTLKVGTAVAVPLRHPLLAASAMATLQALSGGRARFSLGRGDGAMKVLQQKPMPVARFDEYLRRLQGFLRREDVEIDGVASSMARLDDIDPSLARRASRRSTSPRPARRRSSSRPGWADGVSFSVGADVDRLRNVDRARARGLPRAGSDPASLDARLLRPGRGDRRRRRRARARRSAGSSSRTRASRASRREPPATSRRQTTSAYRQAVETMETVYRVARGGVARTEGGAPGEIDFYPREAGADDLIDQFAIAGPAEYCAERLREIAALGIGRIYIGTRAVGVDLDERNAERIGARGAADSLR